MELLWDGNNVKAGDSQSITALVKGCYGENKEGVILLEPEEALYLVDVRGAECRDAKGKKLSFNALASKFKEKKLLARYLTYKDWRDRGLFIRPEAEERGTYGRSVALEYKRGELVLDVPDFEGVFFADDLITTVDNAEVGGVLYNEYWLGQMGTYKAAHRGTISKFDVFETLLLLDSGKLELDVKRKDVFSEAKKRIEYFEDVYNVYWEWREAGYVVKTGFKFGTHFRIYFPGAKPGGGKGWTHSKHVLHVFPRKSSLIISEWARAIRVAHSVKKTFILAIPGKGKVRKGHVDFALYHRKGQGVETPKNGKPSFLMLSLSEDEYLSGEELAASLKTCAERELDLLVAIADRESSVTYYLIKRIGLPGSRYEYYEIEWMQP
ncbi:tRNA-intron lyase [Candidatus Micrarchaeota archaeon]|nr:tRNA-intron lyase [Candidatus Micrarchaeota archaeon]MBD3418064.1 tRNA-intron lyase [Candidatus Micrarchaeota archaeon]